MYKQIKILIKIIAGILLSIGFNLDLEAQTPEWIYFNSAGEILDLFDDGDTLLVGTNGGGFVKLHKYSHEKIIYNRINSGLPSNNIASVFKDYHGHLWIGTKEDGVVYNDGATWISYTEENSELPSNIIKFIREDQRHQIWISTADGIAVITPTGWIIYNNGVLCSPSPHEPVYLRNGTVWVTGSFYGGLSVFDGEEWTCPEQFGPGLPYDVFCLDKDIDENIWAGTEQGIWRHDESGWTLYNSENSLIPDNRIYDLAFDNLNKMWLDTPVGLIQYDTVNVKIFNTENSILPQNVFSAFMVDKRNAVWMGTYGYGLVEYYQDNWNIYDLSNSGLPNNDVKCIDFDSKGQVWIALAGGNLVKFDGYDWTIFDASETGLSSLYYYTCMDIDDQDHLWLGTWGYGVIEFDTKNTKVIVYDSSNSPLPSNSVNALVIDLNNTKWISFLNEDLNYHGLAKFDGENWTTFDAWNAPFTANPIRSMAVDRFNNKWFGTYGDYYGEAKLIKYTDTKWTTYTPPHTSATTFSTIFDIVVDRSDKIWFGTREYLTCFDGTEWLDYPRQEIMSLAIDKEDNIWLGTLNGVVKFNHSEWEEFTAVNSLLPSNQISTIACDNNNNLWVGTVTNGIAVYQKNGAIDVIKNLPKTSYLYQNYPNPFNLSTNIRFYINESGKVSLRIYDVLGRKIKTILDQVLVADMYVIDFDARELASGIYYYQLQASNFAETKKMILLR